MLVAERADEAACLVAVEHDRRGLAVPEGAETEERRRSGGAHMRAVLVRVDDEHRAELRCERSKGAARPRALLECAGVVAEEEIDLAAASELREGGTLERDGSVPVATRSTRPCGKRAAVGETPQVTKTEACSGRQVMQAEAERYRAGRARSTARACERLDVIVVSVDEQKLEACLAKQGIGGA
jgi:hypothetical protein